MMLESVLQFPRITDAPQLYRVVLDAESPDWGKPRTQVVTRPDGSYFSQLPAVYGYSPEPVARPNDYHVNEEPLRQEYIRINNYDGDGVRRCENYLWKGDTALYNGGFFPRRELLTMSTNVLEAIEVVTVNGVEYLKFRTVKPTDNVGHMTERTHPQFIHRFTLTTNSGVTYITPRKYVYYFLTSLQGFAFIPLRNVKAVA